MDNERARASKNLVPSAAIEINLSARARDANNIIRSHAECAPPVYARESKSGARK
jgi:hypothetical protein